MRRLLLDMMDFDLLKSVLFRSYAY
jgi:hypothetical protein